MSATFVVIIVALGMMLVEFMLPGRPWKKISSWWRRAAILNLCQFLIVYLASLTWNQWFQTLPIFRMEPILGTVGSAFVGYFLITFIFYWWHRARHEVSWLWVKLHQVHHSAQRLEVLTAFYKHPVEIAINSMMMAAILYSFLGLSPVAAGITTLLTGLGELLYHWNVKTPYLLGFFFQRPESHCIHHQRGWHTQNYSDLPLWDILFGTFNNPRTFEKSCGFKDNREERLLEMLAGRDVNPK